MIQTLSNRVCYLTNTAKPIYQASNTCPAWTQLLPQLDCIYTMDSCQPSCLGRGYNSSRSWAEELQQQDYIEKKTGEKWTYSTQQSVPCGTDSQSCWPHCSSCPSVAGCSCKAKNQLWMGQESFYLVRALSTALSSTAAWESLMKTIFEQKKRSLSSYVFVHIF